MMAAMSNYGTRRRQSPSDRKAEYFKNLFGTQLIEVPPNQTLRRKPSTYDLTEEPHSSKRPVPQLHNEESYKDLFSGGRSFSHNLNLGLDFENGPTYSPIYQSAPNFFFGNDGIMPREKNPLSLQKPISRPNSKLFVNDANSATVTPMFNEEQPPTAPKQFTSKIWNDYEETGERYSDRKQDSPHIPKVVIQPEFPPLRHRTGLERVNRSLDNHREAGKVNDKAFVDSLFPGGVDAFVDQGLRQYSTNNHTKSRFLLPSPLSSPPPAFLGGGSLPEAQYPTIMKVMSGKQLIEDLDNYEQKERLRARKLSHSISARSLHDHLDRNDGTYSLHNQLNKHTSTRSLFDQFNTAPGAHSPHDQLDRNISTHSLLDKFNHSLRDQLERNTSAHGLLDKQDRVSGTHSLCGQFNRNTNTHSMLAQSDRVSVTHNLHGHSSTQSLHGQYEKVSSTHNMHAQVNRRDSTPILRGLVDENSATKILSNSNLRTEPQTHDVDGRKNKGFRRGHEALQVAISEKWACMDNVLNAPLGPIPRDSRFFVIKSNCELDIFASLKHGIWTSTDLGNKRLDRTFCDPTRKGPVFLFFSVSGSGRFCGLAEMTSAVDHAVHTGIWSDKRWRGRFSVKWLNVKDIPNGDLRQFRVANNDNKPFTNCRDTQEILINPGESVYKLFGRYSSASSVFQSSYEEQQRCSTEELHHI